MARKPTNTDEQQAAVTEAIQAQVSAPTGLEHLGESQNEAQQLQTAYSEERDLVNQLLGQTQMADAFAQFSVTVTTSKLAYVKENKLYRALKGQKSRDGHEFLSGTWQEFCGLIRRSVEQVDEDIRNLRALGEDALESMSRMGIGYRQMRQFRKLDVDDRVALIEAAKTGDREAVEFLAEELIAKHQQEKEKLTSERDEAHADYDAQAEVLAKRAQELDETRQQLARAQKRIQSLPSNEAMKELRMEVSAAAYEAEALIMGKLRGAFELLNTESATSGEDSRDYMASLVKQLEIQILAIREDYDLPDDSSSEHDWMKPGAAEQAAVSLGIESDH